MQSESTRKQIKAVWTILMMLTIWTLMQTVKINTVVPDFNEINKTLNILLERVNGVEGFINEINSKTQEEEYKEIYKEQLDTFNSFDNTFKSYRAELGAGATFPWNGKLYTTNYVIENR